MPPKSEWYVHEFRRKDTGVVHLVATTAEYFKRKETTRAICGTPIPRDLAWRRPGGSDPSMMRCERCRGAIAALDDLLKE